MNLINNQLKILQESYISLILKPRKNKKRKKEKRKKEFGKCPKRLRMKLKWKRRWKNTKRGKGVKVVGVLLTVLFLCLLLFFIIKRREV
jgi:uncharacterized membrane protein